MLATIFTAISDRISFARKESATRDAAFSAEHREAAAKPARSSWSQVRYNAVEEPSVQRSLNMMYAPPVMSIQGDHDKRDEDFAPPPQPEPTAVVAPHARNQYAKRLLTAVGDIVSHPDVEVRKFVASHSQTPVVGLRALAFDPAEQVRLALVCNPNCPGDITKLLVADTSASVSFEAVNRIRRNWVQRKQSA